MHHVILIYHCGRFMIASVGKRNAQEGTKHTICSYTIVILLSCILETETYMFSTGHGTAAAQIWLDIIYTGR